MCASGVFVVLSLLLLAAPSVPHANNLTISLEHYAATNNFCVLFTRTATARLLHASSAVPIKLAYNQAPRCPPATSNRYSIGIFFFFIFLRYIRILRQARMTCTCHDCGSIVNCVTEKDASEFVERDIRPSPSQTKRKYHPQLLKSLPRDSQASDRASQNRIIGRG